MTRKKIDISDLALGMIVVEIGDGSFDSPTTAVHIEVREQNDIDGLIQAGITQVVVDGEAENGGRAHGHVTPEAFVESVSEVHEKMGKAVAYSRSMMEDVRLGKAVDPEAASTVVDTMLDTIFNNESAALFLAKLGSYDDYTYMHCVNVSVLATVFGRHLGLNGEELHDLGMSGLLHDLGKSLIPGDILNKPGKLTADEFAVMQSHPLKGYNLLSKVSGLSREVLNGALQHHEKWNGTGYPGGIKGEKISKFARIIAVVDVYDAMTSNRVYHKKRAETDVLGFLFKQKEHFAPLYVELFVKAVGIYPPGTLVRLSNGKLAVVCAVNPENTLMPVISLVTSDYKITTKCFDLAAIAGTGTKVTVSEVLDQSHGMVDMTALVG